MVMPYPGLPFVFGGYSAPVRVLLPVHPQSTVRRAALLRPTKQDVNGLHLAARVMEIFR